MQTSGSRLLQREDVSMRTTILLAALFVAGACAPERDAYVFRNDDRPEFTRIATVADLKGMDPSAVTLIDVRLKEDFDARPDLIPGATRRDPEAINDWARALPRDKPVVVYCVKGKWVSQKAAAYLSEQGFDVRNLEGGLDAWQAADSQ
jgi:rhodanese-related sulfurtransferase